jgi:hypothetical protein
MATSTSRSTAAGSRTSAGATTTSVALDCSDAAVVLRGAGVVVAEDQPGGALGDEPLGERPSKQATGTGENGGLSIELHDGPSLRAVT